MFVNNYKLRENGFLVELIDNLEFLINSIEDIKENANNLIHNINKIRDKF